MVRPPSSLFLLPPTSYLLPATCFSAKLLRCQTVPPILGPKFNSESLKGCEKANG